WLANSLTDARYRQAGISFPRPKRTGGPGPSCRRTVTVARILIAEDEDAIRSLIARALRQDGHDVVTATDGAQALDALARKQGALERLVPDIRMPVMDGIALAYAAARNHPDITIVLMTGYADPASGRTASMHGSTTSSPSRSRSGRCAARSTTRSARYRGGGISSFSRLISNQGAIPARRNACEILEISQQPVDVFELELRAEVLAEAPAQFFQNAPRALHVDLARHLDRRVVAVVAPA